MSEELPYSYHVYDRDDHFIKQGDMYYRQNQIWRDRIDKVSGKVIDTELVTKNFAEVKYVPADFVGAN